MCDSHWQPDWTFIYPTIVRHGRTMRSSRHSANISRLIRRSFFSCLKKKSMCFPFWRSDDTGLQTWKTDKQTESRRRRKKPVVLKFPLEFKQFRAKKSCSVFLVRVSRLGWECLQQTMGGREREVWLFSFFFLFFFSKCRVTEQLTGQRYRTSGEAAL